MPRRGAVGAEGLVDFSATTMATSADTYVAAPIVHAVEGSRLNAVYAEGYLEDGSTTLTHPVRPFVYPLVADADYPVAPEMECGGEDVTVSAASSPLTLAPGRYGAVVVSENRRLVLVSGGRYELCSLKIQRNAEVEVHADNLVLVRDFVATGPLARMVGDSACGARWIALGESTSSAQNSAAFDFAQGTGASNRALIQGQFFTPGRIVMAQSNDYVGRFWAEEIRGSAGGAVTRTLADCDAARCGDGTVDPGEECDDGNNRAGDCCSSFCELVAEGAACDDGNFCTVVDRCDAAARCVGSGDPCDPPDGDGDCAESCNEETDRCDAHDPDGSACDDGLFCTGADLCAAGACTAHGPSPCPGPDGDGNCRESCDEASRACIADDPVGSACNDGAFCTVADRCDEEGTCRGSGSPCSGADGDGDCRESCDELADTCSAADPAGSGCNDGLFCTAIDECDAHGLCAGRIDPCPYSGDGDGDCTESCDEVDDSCEGVDADGAPCDDGLACTLGERCLAGSCQPSGLTGCDDLDPCTDELCTPDGSCLSTFNAAPCDDGNACTVEDRCDRGECRGTHEIDCADHDLCSLDVCDPADGTCHHVYAPAPDCHDGDGLTRIEAAYAPSDGELRERLTTMWRGRRGEDETRREELGDFAKGGTMAVCFFDESAGLPELAYRLELSPRTSLDGRWKRSWTTGRAVYKLMAPSGTSEGVSGVKASVDSHGVAVFKLKAGAGAGCNEQCRAAFSLPPAIDDGRFFAMEPATTVQWVSDTGACWSSRYSSARENRSDRFYAVARRGPSEGAGMAPSAAR